MGENNGEMLNIVTSPTAIHVSSQEARDNYTLHK